MADFPCHEKEYEKIAQALTKPMKVADEDARRDDFLTRGGYGLAMLMFSTYGREDGTVVIPPLDAVLLAKTAIDYVSEVEASWEDSDV